MFKLLAMSSCVSCEMFFNEVIKVVKCKMTDVVEQLCFGCQHDSPGQQSHDLCLMATPYERFLRTFDKAWGILKIYG